jgi:predicted aldo/keto reductase-like oxidoreductase
MAPVTATDGPSPLPRLENPGELRGEMLYRELGWTGDIVSAIGFGGSHFAKPGIAQNESIRLCHAAIDRGITFMDNSWDYNKGVSETRMGQALSGGYRNKVFLMTKVDGRNTDIAQQQLEQSLKRLQTDRLDLWMFHEVLRYDDPDRVFAPGGAIHAAVAAKQSGKIRHIGFTGHKDPHIHIQMMEVARQHGFQFDVVLMPSNVMDAHLRSFARLAMPVALDDHIGVITMKPFGGSDGVILKSGASIRPIDCLHYALNRPTSVVITGIDNQRALDQAFNAATIFHSYTAADEEGILAAPASAAHTGQFELFKTTDHFDGTAHNPAWLGADTVTTMKLAPKNGG